MTKQIQDAYVVAAVRTPVGKAPRGSLRTTRPDDLLAHAPGLTYTKYRKNLFGTPEVMERLAGALREAGLPT